MDMKINYLIFWMLFLGVAGCSPSEYKFMENYVLMRRMLLKSSPLLRITISCLQTAMPRLIYVRWFSMKPELSTGTKN